MAADRPNRKPNTASNGLTVISDYFSHGMEKINRVPSV